jgi:hypothetical protein
VAVDGDRTRRYYKMTLTYEWGDWRIDSVLVNNAASSGGDGVQPERSPERASGDRVGSRPAERKYTVVKSP